MSSDGWITCPGTWEDAAAEQELVAPKLFPGFWHTDSLLILEVLVASRVFLLELVVCVLGTTRKESLQCQTLFWRGQKRIVSAYEVLGVGLQGCCGERGVFSGMEFLFTSTLSWAFRAVLGGLLRGCLKGNQWMVWKFQGLLCTTLPEYTNLGMTWRWDVSCCYKGIYKENGNRAKYATYRHLFYNFSLPLSFLFIHGVFY